MIKLIVFDLDGVLVDSRDVHYYSLNMALESIDKKYIIEREEHLSTYDGLPTTKKLELLNKNKGLPKELFDTVWKLKQEKTNEYIDKYYVYDERIRNVLAKLKSGGYTIYVASNSIYNTIKMILLRKGFLEYVDYFISNEDISSPKPSPEIYLQCCIRAKVSPNETVVLEDSHIGRQAAINSKCWLLPIENSNDVTFKKINDYILSVEGMSVQQKIYWKGKLNVVIPMAGEGSRFKVAGYTFPKPLIEVLGKPMIQLVVENLGFDPETTNFIFIVRKEHYDLYNLKYLLKLIAPNCKIVLTDGLTEGAACSVLLAKEFIDNDEHLVMANSDQYVEWNSNEFMYSMINDNIDAGILSFNATHPKWSYALLDKNGFVKEVAEKKVISNHATTGIYYWKHGKDFVKYAEQMISKNIRVNNEFYVCPVFNEAIQDGKKIKILDCRKMWGIGVPEDLEYFVKNFK